MKKHTTTTILRWMKSNGRRRNVEGMARFGIVTRKAFGISAVPLRRLARSIGTDHDLSLRLWQTGYLEARVLASLVGDPERVTSSQMDRWVKDFDNWAVCDSTCALFDKTPFAVTKAILWSKREPEFVKRAGFVLMAELAVHDKKAPDSQFERFFPHIRRGSSDPRNYVRKAVNWAIRQIGKRNRVLNRKAIRLSKELLATQKSPARWIATDALKELSSAAVQKRLRSK